MSTREISSVESVPRDWVPATFHIKRLVNDQHPHALDWEDVTVRGHTSATCGCVIFNDRDAAFDLEYWTRGS